MRCKVSQRKQILPRVNSAQLCSCFHRLGFGHVFAFLGRAIKTRAFLVVNMRLGVDPNQAVASARGGRFYCCLSARAFVWGFGHSGETACCRRSLRFKQVAEVEFTADGEGVGCAAAYFGHTFRGGFSATVRLVLCA